MGKVYGYMGYYNLLKVICYLELRQATDRWRWSHAASSLEFASLI